MVLAEFGKSRLASNVNQLGKAVNMGTWLRGKTRRARADHLEYVRRRWRALPDQK
jgi:hypothetical protein